MCIRSERSNVKSFGNVKENKLILSSEWIQVCSKKNH